ncbi:MAG: hypothetical protein ABL982_14875, partial [Vicinamibacterales bacterium]
EAAARCLEAGQAGRRLWMIAADKSVADAVTATAGDFDRRFRRADTRSFLFDPDATTKARFFSRPFLDARITVYVFERRAHSGAEGS